MPGTACKRSSLARPARPIFPARVFREAPLRHDHAQTMLPKKGRGYGVTGGTLSPSYITKIEMARGVRVQDRASVPVTLTAKTIAVDSLLGVLRGHLMRSSAKAL